MKKVFKVIFKKQAASDFQSLPEIVRERILKKLRFWVNSGKPLEFAKRLNTEYEFYRFRVGDYRIIFSTEDQETFVVLLILKIGHRKDVYDS